MKTSVAATFVAAIAVLWPTLVLSGCSVYLHDDDLQKKTTAALASYKSADIPGALKATIDAQAQFNKQLVDSVIANENANRESEIAGLIDSDSAQAVADFRSRIGERLQSLGVSAAYKPGDWKNRQTYLAGYRAEYDNQNGAVADTAWRYAKDGGKGFVACDKPFTPTDGIATGETLKKACALLLKMKAQLDAESPKSKGITKGLIGSVDGGIFAVAEEIKDIAAAQSSAKKELEQAKKNADTATKNATAIDESVTAALQKLHQDITVVDDAAGALGASKYSLGAVLASIEFRKTNLCDILAASAKESCSGGETPQAADSVNKAVVGAIAGIDKILEHPPSTGALSIALAYQTGLGAIADAQLAAVKKRQSLLQDEEDRLLQEAELLVLAHDTLASPIKCKGPGLGDMLSDKNCAGRKQLARALSAYNLGWARGHTAARLDEIALTLLDNEVALQVAQANALARDKVLTITLTELDAFGQGGVKPETIAAFVQAFSTVAIANGVN